MLIAALVLWTASLTSAQAASSPATPFLGDWDLGANSSALRILERDSTSISVFFCDRATLLSAHICNSTVIYNFAYTSSSQNFIHNSPSDGTYATLEVEANDPQHLYYYLKNSAGTDNAVGTRIP